MNDYGAHDVQCDPPRSEPDPDYAYDQMREDELEEERANELALQMADENLKQTPWCWCCHADVIDCNCGIEECPDCHRCENCCNCRSLLNTGSPCAALESRHLGE